MNQSSLIGQTLGGRYRIDELLGQGGMATVYKAYDPNLQRPVAVKVIKAALADDPKFLARFEAEAMAVAQLRHPNIVQVFDFSHDEDLYYMVQEFIVGETLQEHLRRLNEAGRNMPLERVIGYTIDICEAAGYAHLRGMIHRDIKPANIMLDVHDQAILMDFGIVKITDSVEHTVTGAVIGTARYMPPELIRGETPDGRADIYSLGITLYEMVGGRPPFDAQSAMTLLMMQLQDPVPDVRLVRPNVPDLLWQVITRALAKDREERYETMADMALALKGVREQMAAGATLHEQPTQIDEPGSATPALDRTLVETPPAPATPARTSPPGSQNRPPVQPQTPPPGSQSWPQGQAQTPAPGSQNRPPVQAQTPPASSQSWPPPTAAPAEPTPGWGSTGPGRPEKGPGRTLPGRWPLWVGLGALLVVLLAGVGLLASGALGGGGGAATPFATLPAAAATATPSPSPSAAPSRPPIGPTTVPLGPYSQAANTPTTAPQGLYGQAANTATPPSTGPTPAPSGAVTITDIQVDDQGHYIVYFDVEGYTPSIPGTHIHFYFTTFTVDQVGIGGGASRRMWGAPSPFDGYTTADRPDAATQLCAVVANPEHSVRPGTGNCFTLPDIPTVSSSQDLPCLSGPGDTYQVTSQLPANLPALLKGLTADELWWRAVNPRSPGQECWLPVAGTTVNGSISTLPIAQPPSSEAAPAAPSVEITGISLNADSNYVVEFTPSGFVPSIPGNTIHFYFDTVTPDQVGIGGDANRQIWDGPSPFDGYVSSDRPVGATEMCAIVANPDHSVIAGSGNCYPLPSLSVEITGISRNADGNYVVEFTPGGFVPSIPGTHIHFYFDTFTLDRVGIGGDANRYAWDAPSPFDGYASSDRPYGATRMCAIVANPNHSVIAGSGNCFRLPGLPAVQITDVTVNAQGHYVVDFVTDGFTPAIPGNHIHFYFNTFTLDQVGIGGDANRQAWGAPSPFDGYAPADRPQGATKMCAVVADPNHSVLAGTGNCYPLPDVLGVEITGITVNGKGHYVVEYDTWGFALQDPGTHVHFYFDSWSPENLDQLGIDHRYSSGNSKPFTHLTTADRPAGASQMCAVVIRPDDSIATGSGNCFPLP
ncbi:MAG: serine/threonine-protein kinase [Anaerolineae bacterium]